MDDDRVPTLTAIVPGVLDQADVDWRYVPVRRRLLFLEHSISVGLQWVVFEPQTEQLWRQVVSSVSDFLLTQWQDGQLQGATPDEAFFVRCDRTTMTQADIDNGRLIVLVGLAAVRPAEFVIVQIGQWTAETPDC
ncbi:hypothetical protein acdb102_02540 [Acidothermaceae bacterium B102]|nr:hypothetical protein acdb102_02540 [Acidothermaceae bacterium B102]